MKRHNTACSGIETGCAKIQEGYQAHRFNPLTPAVGRTVCPQSERTKEFMHITKVSAGNEFYATAWCGEKLGMLDRCYMSVDNALKAIENKVGEFPCQQCLSAVVEAAQQSVQRTELCSGVGHSVYESVINPGHCHVCGKLLSR